jgi:asparagine synthase (glutamine-hydrolysing)
VRKLEPGRTLTWSLEAGLEERRYWRLPLESDDRAAGLDERARDVGTHLESTVRSHLMSDVPLGLFLSGGIDSSALAAIMAPMAREPIRTFSVGFSEAEANELDYARLAANAVGAHHRDVIVSPKEFFEALPRLIWHEDEPIAFPSSVPLYFVSRLAQQHVKVVLTGEGADELFLGYNRYRVTAWNQRLGGVYNAMTPAPARRLAAELIRGLPKPLRRYAERSFLALPPGPRGLFFENFAVFPTWMQRDLWADGSRFAGTDPYAEALRLHDEGPGGTLDQMSMAASVESRVPFLDHEFVEHVTAMPSRFKVRGWRTKAVFREAVRELVPRSILTRPKMGFPVPVGRWLRGRFWPVVEEFVLGQRALERGFFNPIALERLAMEHREGLRDHGDRLWLLVNLELWQRVYLDGDDLGTVLRASA